MAREELAESEIGVMAGGAGSSARARARLGGRFGVTARTVAAILVPVLAMSVFVGLLVVDGVRTSEQARTIERQVPALNALVRVRATLGSEWAVTATAVFAGDQGEDVAQVIRQLGINGLSTAALRAATDAAIAGAGGLVSSRDQSQLAALRQEVDRNAASVAALDAGYGRLSNAFVSEFAARVKVLRNDLSQLGDGGQQVTTDLTSLEATDSLLANGAGLVSDLGEVWFQAPGQRDAAFARLNQNQALVEQAVGQLDEYASGGLRVKWMAVRADPPRVAFNNVISAVIGGEGLPRTGGKVDSAKIAAAFRDGFAAGPVLYGFMGAVTESLVASAARLRANAVAGYENRLVTGVLLVASSFVVALLLAMSITRPLARVRIRAQEVVDGVLEFDPLDCSGPRETAVVSAALNDLVSNLRLLEAKAQALAACAFEDPILDQQVPGQLGRSLHESVTVLLGSIVERDALQHDLAYKATHDALTGLYNRAAAIDALTRSLASAQRSGEPLALLHLDLDDFKRANDTHGHGVGDRILAEVAAQMTATVRGGEFIARVGGDEFVVITDRIKDTSEATVLAERLIEAVSEPIEVSGLSLTVGASVGVALALDGHEDPMQLLARADLAVSRAKQRGRCHVEQYDESLQRALLERADVEQALAVALRPDSDELVLHYQPLTRAETGTVLGVEALVRWNRPGHEQWRPDRFIPIAEASNLIIDLDRWVLSTAVRQLAQWSAVGELTSVYVAVNISGRHLVSGRLVQHLGQILARTGVDPARLLLEITETVLVEDLIVARRELEALHQLGVRIAIDDFGTGYTSLGQLAHLPVDVIKIDRSFITDIHQHPERSLVQMVTELGHQLGVTIVAEGVETDSQLSTLQTLGCDTIQGFLISKPLLPADLAQWHQSREPASLSA